MKVDSFVSQRPMVALAVSFGAGILLARCWTGFVIWIPFLGLIMALFAVITGWNSRLPRLAALCFIALFLGMLRAGPVLYPKLPFPGIYQVNGTVAGEAVLKPEQRRVQAVLNDVQLENENGIRLHFPRLYWTFSPEEGFELPLDGQKVQFSGSVYIPRGQQNPFGFDFQLYLLQKNIPMGVSGAKKLLYQQPIQLHHQDVWLRVRQSLSNRLDLIFGAQSALPKALLLGVRDGLDEEVNQDFRDAGIAHILAVSGLHVGLMMAVLLKLLRKAYLSPKALLLVAGILLLSYSRLLDFSPSIVRASVLVMLWLLARVFKRRSDPLTNLALAFLVVLLIQPLDLFNIGFQLSFLAVLGIFTLGDWLRHWVTRQNWCRKAHPFLQGTVQAYLITFSASAFTLVPLVNTFHRFSIIGLIINPLACLLIGWLMPAYALLLLLSSISPLMVQALAGPVNWFSMLYQQGAGLFARMPLATLSLPHIPVWLTAIYFSLLCLSARYCALRPKRKRIIALILLSFCAAIPAWPNPRPVEYIQLSSGNADSAVVVDGQTAWVVDTGTHGGDLAGLLQSRGLTLEKLILTHLHTDHMGGLQQLLDARIPIGEIILPTGAMDTQAHEDCMLVLDAAKDLGIPIKEIGAGDVLEGRRITAQALWPYKKAFYPGQDPNRGSLVLYWELDGVSLLSASDISADYAPYVVNPAQIYKLPHHGSRQDNPENLLAMANPNLAIITADNRQQDRYQAAQNRLDALGALTLITGDTGAITLQIKQGKLIIQTHRKGR